MLSTKNFAFGVNIPLVGIIRQVAKLDRAPAAETGIGSLIEWIAERRVIALRNTPRELGLKEKVARRGPL